MPFSEKTGCVTFHFSFHLGNFPTLLCSFLEKYNIYNKI